MAGTINGSFRKTVATLIDDEGLSARIGGDHLGHTHVSMPQDRYMARGHVHTQVADLLGQQLSPPGDDCEGCPCLLGVRTWSGRFIAGRPDSPSNFGDPSHSNPERGRNCPLRYAHTPNTAESIWRVTGSGLDDRYYAVTQGDTRILECR
jgi:hypothetical protein